MHASRLTVATSVLVLAFATGASAQFGIRGGLPAQLPDDDFTWTWGQRRGIADFTLRGTDQGFTCVLNGAYRAGNRMTTLEIREFENGIRTAFRFVEAATYGMNNLDNSRLLQWAVLDCERPDDEEG